MINLQSQAVKIVHYQESHQEAFERLNREWIEQYFWMEPVDFQVLQRPDEHIIKKGGQIFIALIDEYVVGTVALKFAAPGIYEFTKMAVDVEFRGKQIGKRLADAAIDYAKNLKASKIILYSNTVLGPAIELYRKLGFVQIPVDGPYKRSNIKMELTLR